MIALANSMTGAGIHHVPSQAIAILMLLLLAGCANTGLKVQSGHDPAFDFSHLHAWNWAPKGGELKSPAALKTSERIQLDALVGAHVGQRLGQKGFVREQNEPDFLVAWSFGEWGLDRHTRPNGGYGAVGLMYPGFHGSNLPRSSDGRALPPTLDPYSSQYEEAKLEFAIIDPRTSRVIWNATVTDESDFGYFTSSQKRRIGAAVDQMFDGFPPSSAHR